MSKFQQSLDEDLKQRQLQNVDSIIATRQRRANAGNRLQSLLNSENPLIEEDEETSNIFKELDDDEDYDVEAEKRDDSEGYGDEGEVSEQGETVDTRKRRVSGPSTSRRGKRIKSTTPGDANSTGESDIDQKDDDMFSDSADSDSEDDNEDEDEGEKELLKQQREERRRSQKKKRDALTSMPAALVKAQQRQKQHSKAVAATDASEIERLRLLKRQRMRLSADNLMSDNRRRSTRKAAVKNKEDVIQRLKESEARRAKQPTPTAKVVHRMTQEERLAEAVITEKKNIESLHSFYEQEEDRRKKQRAALLAKRVPMSSFIRYISKTTLEPAFIPKPFVEEITTPALTTKAKRDWKKRKDGGKGVKEEKGKTENTNSSIEPTIKSQDKKVADSELAASEDSSLLPIKSIEADSTEISQSNEADLPTSLPHEHSDEIFDNARIADSRRSTSVEQLEADYIIFNEEDPELDVKTNEKDGKINNSQLVVDEPQDVKINEDDVVQNSKEVSEHMGEDSVDEKTLGEESLNEGSLDDKPLDDKPLDENTMHDKSMDLKSVELDVPVSLDEQEMMKEEPIFTDSHLDLSEVVNDQESLPTVISKVDSPIDLHEETEEVVVSAIPESSEAQENHPGPILEVDSKDTKTPPSTDGQDAGTGQEQDQEQDQVPNDVVMSEPNFPKEEGELSIVDVPNPPVEVEHIDPSKLVVEGPAVCRALTTISLMEFPQSFHYTVPEIKTILFGSQSLAVPVIPDRAAIKPYPTSAAATQAILRGKVSGAGTGQGGRKKKNDKAANKISILGGTAGRGGIFGAVGGSSSSIMNSLSSQRNLSALGHNGVGGLVGANGGVQPPTASLALTATPVVPATAATPTGASAAATLANAGIPKCVVTGKPCKFVDPRTGIPYSSMEAFQIIRTVTSNTVPWNKDFGVYVGAVGGRHAKGVPPGFGDSIDE